jgi:hypothetical protein
MTSIPETTPHLTAAELEQWAEGLLPAGRAMHLTTCTLCHDEAERERMLYRALARLPRLAPHPEFADRVMRQVRIPTRSGGYTS